MTQPVVPSTEFETDLLAMLADNPKGLSALFTVLDTQIQLLHDAYTRGAKAVVLGEVSAGRTAYILGGSDELINFRNALATSLGHKGYTHDTGNRNSTYSTNTRRADAGSSSTEYAGGDQRSQESTPSNEAGTGSGPTAVPGTVPPTPVNWPDK